MPSRFAAVTNKEISQLITKKVTKFGVEVLTGKALSFWLEFINKTEKVFCLQMLIKLQFCVTLVSVASGGIYLAANAASVNIHPPLATSTSVNNCYTMKDC